MNEKIKVLIVDSSAIFRQTLTRILTSDPAIEVIATASDPYIAANKMIVQVVFRLIDNQRIVSPGQEDRQ